MGEFREEDWETITLSPALAELWRQGPNAPLITELPDGRFVGFIRRQPQEEEQG